MNHKIFKNMSRVAPAAAVVATLLVASAAHAATAPKLVLSGFTDAAEGEQLLAGDYSTVIQKLAPHAAAFNADEVAASTNLCVAYVASGQLGAAHGACDEAIQMARLGEQERSVPERIGATDPLTVAYANRAVLTQLSGE